MKQLIADFEALRARFPPVLSRRWCCCLRRIQEVNGFISPMWISIYLVNTSVSLASRSRKC